MMTVTVFYKGNEDDVIENVVHATTLDKLNALQITFLNDEGRRMFKIVYLDADTEIKFGI